MENTGRSDQDKTLLKLYWRKGPPRKLNMKFERFKCRKDLMDY